MRRSRSQKALMNTVAGLLNEFVVMLCGLILPRLILSTFGSSYNGITSSISQFISCIALMKSGIGGVTRAALYKPLAENNILEISAILYQSEKFLRRVAVLFIAFVLGFAVIYPIFICTDFDWFFTFSLIIIISISTFAQYYFGLTYQLLLNADQRQCVVSAINIVTTILNTIISAILIKMGFGFHTVKLGSAIIFVLNPLFISRYTKKYYKLVKNVNNDIDLIKQRWDAMGHEFANFVNSNADVMILTVFADIKEVSVYSVYYYVINGIRMVVSNFITGFGAAFGNMYAKEEYDLMQKNMRIYELIVFSLTTVIYSTTMVMLVPFVMLYTEGINDVAYARPLFAVIVTIAGAFTCYRIPYQTVVTAVGHYKQTRNGAIFEAVLHIIISVLGAIRYGLIGVSLGTAVATIFRSTQYAVYLGQNVLPRNIFHYLGHVFLSLLTIALISYGSNMFLPDTSTVYMWIVKAIVVTLLSIIATVAEDVLLYRADMVLLLRKVINVFKRNSRGY